jgi:hypothetical protein
MTGGPEDVLVDMARLWKATPPAGIRADTYGRNHAVTAIEINKDLAARFGDRVVQEQVLRFLDRMCDLYQEDRVPSRAELFICDCALAMLDLVRRIVRLFTPAVWYSPIRDLVGHYLTMTQLVDTLSASLYSPPHANAQQDALTAFRLYVDKARPDSDPERDRAVGLAMKKIEDLSTSSDAEVARLAQNAIRALRSWQSTKDADRTT